MSNASGVYRSGDRNTLVFMCGTNDLEAATPTDAPTATATASSIFSQIRAYCAARRSEGWKVVVMTIMARNHGTWREYARGLINDSIRANWPSFADDFYDMGADPLVGVAGWYNDLTYALNDGAHPNAAGNDVIAANVFTKVQ